MRYPFPQSPKPSYRRPHSSAPHDRDPPTLAKRPRCSRPLLFASNSRRREGPRARAVWAARASRLVMRLVIRDDYFFIKCGEQQRKRRRKIAGSLGASTQSAVVLALPRPLASLYSYTVHTSFQRPRDPSPMHKNKQRYTTLNYTTLFFGTAPPDARSERSPSLSRSKETGFPRPGG